MIMNENLLGYALCALDSQTHERVDAYVKSHPEARRRLEQLQRALAPLASDRHDGDPPLDLVMNTLARVAEHSCRDVPHAPQISRSPPASPRPFWRRADVLVAATILLTVLGVGIPWVSHVRRQAMLTECQANLRQFYTALKVYCDKNGNFPNVATAAKPPRNIAGLVVPMLRDAGTLTDDISVRCPANGGPVIVTWSIRDLEQLDPAQFDEVKSKLVSCYAYSLGYRNDDAVVLSLDYDPGTKPLGNLPIMADCPPRDAWKGNSPNHGGKGQNVLYLDGHVSFCTTRDVGFERDDIFLNRDKKLGAGLDWKDGVLGGSEVNP
jgi:prepilin-type processing-associated H-X9-DG protein